MAVRRSPCEGQRLIRTVTLGAVKAMSSTQRISIRSRSVSRPNTKSHSMVCRYLACAVLEETRR